MNRASQMRMAGYALIALAAVLGWLIKSGTITGTLVTPLSTVASLAFMAGAVFALVAILTRLKSQGRDRNQR